jgi:Uncharacterised nucleotidyltransferase
MNPTAFVTAVAQIGAETHPGPIPALEDPEAWPLVVNLAVEHRVAPLLWEAMSASRDGSIPRDVLEALEAQAVRSAATRLLCENALADVLRASRARDVELLVLKGPTVAYTAYPRPELRIYHDLDVLCRVEDYPTLRRALLSEGYTDAGTLDARGSQAVLADKPSPSESHSVRAFYDRSGEVKIEVHFDLLQLGLFDRHQEDIWREARTLKTAELEMRVLSPEHQFLHLAVHAHRHCYSRLSWLIELDVLLRRQRSGIDWERTANVARDEGVGAILRHAMATAHFMLGTPVPALPPLSLEERWLQACYRLLWPFQRACRLNQHERHRLLHFLPDDADPRNVLYGLVLVGRRREKLQALFRRRLVGTRWHADHWR